MTREKSTTPADIRVKDLLLELGTTHLSYGNYDQAIEKLHELVEIDPMNAEVHAQLSQAYILKKQFDSTSQVIFEETLKFTPDDLVINKVLCQIYLKNKRLDENAINIYLKILRADEANSENLLQSLLLLSLSNNDEESALKLLLELEIGSERFRNSLQFYLTELWKKNNFLSATQMLSKLLKKKEDRFFQRLFVFNQLKAKRILQSAYAIADDTLEILIKFVHETEKFDELIDIYLFLAANRLLKKIPAKHQEQAAKQIEEYELFLSGNSFSNIWDKGLAKQDAYVSDAGVDYFQLWDKLSVWQPRDVTSIQSESDSDKKQMIQDIFNNANCLLILNTKSDHFSAVEDIFLGSCRSQSSADLKSVYGFSTNDGMLLFGENVATLTKIMADFLNKQLPKNNGNIFYGLEADGVVHTISLAQNSGFNYLFDDLEIALSILDFERRLASPKKIEQTAVKQSHIFITSSVHRLIQSDHSILSNPSDNIVEHPGTFDKYMVYKLCCENTLIKIKSGDVKTIGRYNLIKELFQNEVFISYKAIDTYLERPVIVKILRPEFVQPNSGFISDELFLTSAKSLGKYNQPDIAVIYDVGKEEDLCYFAREYIEGEPLHVSHKIIKKNEWQNTIQLGITIADILAHAHQQNIIHGRLKPSNIFVLNKNSVKLTDFQIKGLFLPVPQITSSSLVQMTYQAPELIKDNFLNPACDIYSLGLILYELLTGVNPFLAEERQKILDQIFNKTPELITDYQPKLPIELNNVIFKAAQKEIKKRFKRMLEFSEALKKITS